MFRFVATTIVVAGALLMLNCGGGSSSERTSVQGAVSVIVIPSSATVSQGMAQDFRATVSGTTSADVTWIVQETAGGTIDRAGRYTAPQTAGTFHVVAKLKSDSTVRGTATVTVPAFVSILPATDTLGPKGMRHFVAKTDDGSSVAWSIQEGVAGGSITSDGLYAVPDHLGMFHVIATSLSNPSKSAIASVAVVASGFAETGHMIIGRSGHTATLLNNGKVLIAGGTASAELFDPASETFTLTGSMTTLRYGATATLLANGKVLIVGGFAPCATSCPLLSTAELYDPLTGTFIPTGSMAHGRMNHTATLLSDGKVLIAGGGAFASLSSAEVYDPTTGKFTSAGSMVSERVEHTATLLANGEVLIVGGWNGHRPDAADDPPWDPLFAELFDPSTVIFKNSASMSTTRIGHSATRLLNGEVLVLGGVPDVQNIHEQPPNPHQAELYKGEGFSATGNPLISRTSHRATLLTNGKVLVIGGAHSDRAVASVELYDPSTGMFSATGGLLTERLGHTATLLLNGQVLVTGGIDANGTTLSSAELYK